MDSRTLVRIALLAALIAVLGQLPSVVLPFTGGVPITAQTLGVMLAGIVLGARNGALAVILFIFIVALGAPLLAGGRGGLAVFFGPTVGFLLGWIPAAYVTGYLMERLRNLPVFVAAAIAAAVGGILVDYAFGIAGLMAVAHLSLGQALAAVVAFIPGDLLKVAAAALVAQAAVRTYPSALSSRA